MMHLMAHAEGALQQVSSKKHLCGWPSPCAWGPSPSPPPLPPALPRCCSHFVVARMTASKSMSRLRGGSTPGNRSDSRPLKITMS